MNDRRLKPGIDRWASLYVKARFPYVQQRASKSSLFGRPKPPLVAYPIMSPIFGFLGVFGVRISQRELALSYQHIRDDTMHSGQIV